MFAHYVFSGNKMHYFKQIHPLPLTISVNEVEGVCFYLLFGHEFSRISMDAPIDGECL